MILLAIRTDKPEAELYLFQDGQKVAELSWQAHRQLAESLHSKIDEILVINKLKLDDVTKIGVFKGPGSFTGLRIGLSVANALSYSLNVPIVGAVGDQWLDICIADDGQFQPISPEYGSEPHITPQKK